MGEKCDCYRCEADRGQYLARMIVCPVCGSKRCPHATDHREACTGSNEPGQAGSRYSADWFETRAPLSPVPRRAQMQMVGGSGIEPLTPRV